MSVWQISLITVIMACIGVLIKAAEPQFFTVFSLCCILWLTFICVSSISPLVQYANQLAQSTPYGEYIPYVIKSLSVGIGGNICCEFCKDAGQNALANTLQGVCKLAIMALCLPLIKEIAQIALSYV